MKKKIEAVQWMFGMNKKEAKQYIKETDPSTVDTIVSAYKNNAVRVFYADQSKRPEMGRLPEITYWY